MQELDRVVHQWCDDNDRWMYIEYDRDGKVMGLNFMQGDEYECFKKSWCVSDQGMTDFYKQMLYTFAYEQRNVPEHAFINSCMWAYHSAISSRDEYCVNSRPIPCQKQCAIYKTNTTVSR